MTEETAPVKRRRRRKTQSNIDEVKASLGTLLPSLIETATQSYEAFCQTDVPEDAKGFAAHHAACKAALSHVEVLTKLVKWARDEDQAQLPTLSEDEQIAGLLAGARAALEEMET